MDRRKPIIFIMFVTIRNAIRLSLIHILINSYKPDLVMNIALPYQDLTIMDACLACGVNYMDCLLYTSRCV